MSKVSHIQAQNVVAFVKIRECVQWHQAYTGIYYCSYAGINQSLRTKNLTDKWYKWVMIYRVLFTKCCVKKALKKLNPLIKLKNNTKCIISEIKR